MRDDPSSFVPDTGSSNLTFFGIRLPSGRARSNSFSYGAASSPRYAAADRAVTGFIAEIFPDC